MANQVRIEKVGPPATPFPAREPAVPKGTLAAQLVDAAAAQLLLADELPADERPRDRDRVLLVGLVWGGQTLVEIEQVETGADLRAGKLFAAVAFLVAFVMMVRLAPRTVPGSSEDLQAAQDRIAQYVAKPQPPKEIEQPRFKDLSGAPEGAKARDEEGKLGKEEAKKKEADPSRKGSPVADLNKKEADRRKVAKLGLIAALAKVGAGAGAASNVLGPGGIGSGVNPSLGGVTPGAGLGDPYGVGGLGARGTGSGGGGTAIATGGPRNKGARGGGGRLRRRGGGGGGEGGEAPHPPQSR